jgi:hypothetical protein
VLQELDRTNLQVKAWSVQNLSLGEITKEAQEAVTQNYTWTRSLIRTSVNTIYDPLYGTRQIINLGHHFKTLDNKHLLSPIVLFSKVINFKMSSPQAPPPSTSLDPFDSLLTLEDTLYTTAYTAGATAGSRAGRIEGRIFGLESGFDKFATLGELHGRSVVWGARALSKTSMESTGNENAPTLPKVKDNSRLQNNITLLHALTDPLTFSTENTEEAVADFDDRVKRAGAKAKVIERIVGETVDAKASLEGSPARGGGGVRLNEGKKKGGDDSMEDFVAGARVLR